MIQYRFIPNVMIRTNRRTTWSHSPAPYDGGVVMEVNPMAAATTSKKKSVVLTYRGKSYVKPIRKVVYA